MRKDYFVTLQDTASEKLDKLNSVRKKSIQMMGVPTGFRDFDSMTGGLQESELIVVGGRPAMGKTAFALSIACNLAIRQKRPVAFFSLEMSKEQLTNRILGMEAHVDGTRIKTGELTDDDWVNLINSADVIGTSNLYIDDTPGITVDEICERSTGLKGTNGLDLIIVDYLQLIRSSNEYESRQKEITVISRKLKELSKKLKVPVIILSQLSRATEQREDHHPLLSDFRECGAIEQDADMVIFLYRDDYYNKDSKNPGIVQISIAKHRNGNCGMLFLVWDRNFAEFKNIDAKFPWSIEAVSVSAVMSIVCRKFGVDENAVISKRRDESLVKARQIIMYLCRKHTDLSLDEIGKKLGKRDHTSVMSGISKVKNMIENDEQYAKMIEEIERELWAQWKNI